MSLSLFDVPTHTVARARATDLATSHEAAASLTEAKITKAHWHVLACLHHFPMIDPELYGMYVRLYGAISESGCRSRRAELVELGYVVGLRTVKALSGRKFTQWSLTDKGRQAAMEAQ
jgi:hypothetical protein